MSPDEILARLEALLAERQELLQLLADAQLENMRLRENYNALGLEARRPGAC